VGGGYRPCCNSESYFEFKDDTKSIKQAFESTSMDEIRSYMQEGKEHPACEVCYARERNNGLSFRHTYTVDKFKEFVDSDADEKIKYLDLRFDNVCNLACRMCDPSSSNQLYSAIEWYREKDKPLPDHWKGFKNYKQKDQAVISNKRKDYVIELLPNIEVLKVTGGEPFISKDFLEVLDHAIENDYAKNIRLLITTNGTKFVKAVLQRLKHFKGVDMNVSVDGSDYVYDYVRYPFTWKKWNERFLEFLEFADANEMYKNEYFRIRTSTVVTAYNWLNCPDLYIHLKSYVEQFPWLEKKNYIPRIDFNLNLRPKDSEMSAKWLPDSILDKGLELWKQTDCRQIKEFEKYVTVAKQIKSDDKNLYKEKLKYTTNTLDQQRNQSFAVLDSEIVEWLK
jgi:MoaA/NifB/PqqE/SkfB family radical SAM enzyme